MRSFGWYETDEVVFISMEYLRLGDLERYLESPLPESEASTITHQLLEGLVFMHDNKFAHRDLKPRVRSPQPINASSPSLPVYTNSIVHCTRTYL